MAITSVGNFGSSTPQPAAPQGGAPAQQAARPEVQLQAPQPSQPPPERAKIEQVVKELKQLVDPVVANGLDFSIDDSTGKSIVRITDNETGELIRQIPSEEMLAIAQSLDRMQGLLLRQEA
ncbi:MAG: flagellar protein FlaG [Gammaproteobacteria bacterium]|nr:flagellar protein FlaG [Rhodocyclaceae bacterium]MBU3909557.1 flagellar protein FlaG [Gammaproteobacteria bacterium]MBU3990840.1 flagellar protein FlaG [Gammaproteobacteria bacterium]MBU4003220.1 flagellar protein FlaG [Gammaproteobacteria bacterium]MBU4022269.1 flagellar protein FlaG [Gammaproteobacteria bacterium]